MFPGETIASGADATCDYCSLTPELRVYSSQAGYYVGTYCKCGPYSRESGYYHTYTDALAALATGTFGR
jgi:hypothetical protein